MLGGSDTAATSWLIAHGVKEADLAAWGWREDIRGLTAILAPLARLRAPGSRENMLERK
jgi:hypothetical protein